MVQHAQSNGDDKERRPPRPHTPHPGSRLEPDDRTEDNSDQSRPSTSTAPSPQQNGAPVPTPQRLQHVPLAQPQPELQLGNSQLAALAPLLQQIFPLQSQIAHLYNQYIAQQLGGQPLDVAPPIKAYDYSVEASQQPLNQLAALHKPPQHSPLNSSQSVAEKLLLQPQASSSQLELQKNCSSQPQASSSKLEPERSSPSRPESTVPVLQKPSFSQPTASSSKLEPGRSSPSPPEPPASVSSQQKPPSSLSKASSKLEPEKSSPSRPEFTASVSNEQTPSSSQPKASSSKLEKIPSSRHNASTSTQHREGVLDHGHAWKLSDFLNSSLYKNSYFLWALLYTDRCAQCVQGGRICIRPLGKMASITNRECCITCGPADNCPSMSFHQMFDSLHRYIEPQHAQQRSMSRPHAVTYAANEATYWHQIKLCVSIREGYDEEKIRLKLHRFSFDPAYGTVLATGQEASRFDQDRMNLLLYALGVSPSDPQSPTAKRKAGPMDAANSATSEASTSAVQAKKPRKRKITPTATQ